MGAAGNCIAADEAVPLGKVASPQAMTEGVIIGSAAYCENAALRGGGLALSVTACAVPPLPKGEARALPEAFSLHLKL